VNIGSAYLRKLAEKDIKGGQLFHHFPITCSSRQDHNPWYQDRIGRCWGRLDRVLMPFIGLTAESPTRPVNVFNDRAKSVNEDPLTGFASDGTRIQ
jgi:hypothetical protein